MYFNQFYIDYSGETDAYERCDNEINSPRKMSRVNGEICIDSKIMFLLENISYYIIICIFNFVFDILQMHPKYILYLVLEIRS